jgi:hypothetical protein
MNKLEKEVNSFGKEITTDKAQDALNRLSQGRNTINQIRSEFELEPIEGGDEYSTTVQFGSKKY